MGFPRQEYWSELPFPPSGDLPDPGIEPTSPVLADRFFTASATWEASTDHEQGNNSTFAQITYFFHIRANFQAQEVCYQNPASSPLNNTTSIIISHFKYQSELYEFLVFHSHTAIK